MDSVEFRRRGKEMVDFIANYMDTINGRRVTPEVEPGYLRNLLPGKPPLKGDKFEDIMNDVERAIMPGITHWQHPNFHAYFPAGNSFPSILGDMMSNAIGCVGFSWAASPACTELETLVLDWIGKSIGLPKQFLHEEGKGGGVIQGSASECVLVMLLAARHKAMTQLKKQLPYMEDGVLLSKLVAYSSKLAHSCVEKAGMLGFVKMRQLDVDEQYSLRGHVLERAIEEDRRLGLIPFFVCSTIGTTACCSFDNVAELGEVCARENVWLHVDAAYAGNALICPEFRFLMSGIQNVTSINFNPNKWLLVNFDCSLLWISDNSLLTSSMTVDPLYLQHKHDDKTVDLRHWGIPLSRRFRALKLWFVLRTYGIEGLQAQIHLHVKLAKLFETFVKNDARFEILGKVAMGLVCFRLKGPNSLTAKLLHMINESGKLHMVPALLNEVYVIRFAICAQNAKEEDIEFAWKIISTEASSLLMEREYIENGMNTEKLESAEQKNPDIDDVFPDFDDEFIFDQQKSNLHRARLRRSLFMRMVSDPKCYNPKVLKALCTDKKRTKSTSSDEIVDFNFEK
ncbi:aromatic-L-amino-acid decarboxylase-like [Saccostrea echinata]|uniref:aromatic-L-amino-acid decarboxylase-like n=1 Tax=Saccostrea echinata TaxID=191078 RepID=UPI002A81D3CC|nr:aromatic-L-amino-acid decarboxylase-like [Saccostrea echinata]